MDARLSKAQIRQVYSRLASIYDLWGNLAESKARRRCLQLAGIKNGEAVLEVAVGTGILFEQILKLNPAGRNEGIDLTEAMLARAKARAAKCVGASYALKVGDAYQLEYRDHSFDVVLNTYMFDLLPEEDFLRVLMEFKRVLREGGRVVVVNMTKGKFWFSRIWGWLYRLSPALVGGCRGIELGRYVEAAGFSEIRREYISQLMFPSEVTYGVRPRK